MKKTSESNKRSLESEDLKSTKKDGLSKDFFGGIPQLYSLKSTEHLKFCIDYFASGQVRTYTQYLKEQDDLGDLLRASDPQKVAELDLLVLEARQLAKDGDIKGFKEKIIEIREKKPARDR